MAPNPGHPPAPPGKGCYWDEHLLTGRSGTISCPDWEWAEMDRHRLVWAAGGKLFAARLDDSGLADPAELYDFNNMKFVRLSAPY